MTHVTFSLLVHVRAGSGHETTVHMAYIRAFLLLASILEVAFALQNFQKDTQFLEWCSQYYRGKSDEYLAKIYPTWKENADFVEHHNSLGLSYTLSMNQFGHLDFSNRKTKSIEVHASANVATKFDHSPIPTSIDWREKGAITPVKNQEECGLSGIFPVIDSVIALGEIRSGKLVGVSTQEFLDCCTNGTGCKRRMGNPLSSFECIGKLGGLESSESYPSHGNESHECRNDPNKIAMKIEGGKAVPEGDEMALAAAVATEPVMVMVDASRTTFHFYSGGIYFDPSCSSTKLDHAMLVVGYGEENGRAYWICKNSWGASWGDEGYIRIARNANNMCGIATDAAYPY